MTITLTVARRIACITLEQPPVNALDRQHQLRLEDLAVEVTRDERVHAVILTGAGNGFSAGADIREMRGLAPEQMQAHAPVLSRTFTAVANIPKPVFAAIEGYALGGGLELALCADFRVCAEGAHLGLPEIKLGVIPGAGGTQRLSALVGPARAKAMIMTGESITATRAEEIGLVDQTVPPGTALAAARAMLAPLVTGPRQALAAAKRAVNAASHDDGFGIETSQFAELFFTADQQEGMAAFLEKRRPRFH